MIETKDCDDWKKILMIEKDCDYKNYDRKYRNDYSSIVNDGIGEVFHLLKKDTTSTKGTKRDSLHRYFYAYKKHKALNKRLHKKHKTHISK